MKSLKAQPTIIVKGIFRKKYYLILPDLGSFGVYELPIYPFDKIKEEQERQNAKSKV